MKKFYKKNLATVLVVCVVLVAMFSNMVACNSSQIPVYPDSDNSSDVALDEYKVELFSAPATVAEDGTITKIITATVKPETATNKLVDWSISWLNPNNNFERDNDVNDFVSLSVESDGGNVATVTVLSPFEDAPIQVKVVTRDGGYTATTNLIYVGIPISMLIAEEGERLENGCLIAKPNSENLYDITLETDFGISSDEYWDEFADLSVTKVTVLGNLYLNYELYDSSTDTWELHDSDICLSLSEGELEDFVNDTSGGISIVDNWKIYAHVEGKNLVLETGSALNAYYADVTWEDDDQVGRYTYSKGTAMIYVEVTDSYTGITNTAAIEIVSLIEGVEVDNATIYF